MNTNKNIAEDEIILAPPTELFEEAKQIAESTSGDDKFLFTIQYDVNQKEFLLSVMETAGVNTEDVEANTITVLMNMTQLKLIKSLDCVERVMTDEGRNMFIAQEAALENLENESAFESVESAAQSSVGATPTVRTMPLDVDESFSVATVDNVSVNLQENDGLAVIANYELETSSCCLPSNATMATAKTISVESFMSGNICCPGAAQWFKFTVPESATYTIYTTGSLDTIGTLYDSCGNEIVEVDDYRPCGKLNFRIIRYLGANTLYYIRVGEAKNNTGSYSVKVTQKRLVDSVAIDPSEITLDHIGKVYELPMIPNIFVGVEGTTPVADLVVSITPSSADEKKIFWHSPDRDVIKIETGWYNGRQYQTLTIMNTGTAKLYAYDWNENGKCAECTVNAGGGWPVFAKPDIHTRQEWEARPVVKERKVECTEQPKLIIFHHTADKFSSTDRETIINEIKETQNEHMDDDGKCDIAYHFIIDPAGEIWQGAEIDGYQRGHANGHFCDIGVVLLGDFESRLVNFWTPNVLNNQQKEAMKKVSKWLCYEYDLPIDKVNGVSPITTHKAASGGTECPGDNVEPWVNSDLRTYINNWHP